MAEARRAWAEAAPKLDPAKPVFLIYGGLDADAPLVGVSYLASGADDPPEGLTRPARRDESRARRALDAGPAVDRNGLLARRVREGV